MCTENKNEIPIKVITVGAAQAGKTSLIERLYDDKFTPEACCTIGVDFRIKKINYQGQMIKLMLWDTAGGERFRSLTNSYYRNAKCVLIAFDLTYGYQLPFQIKSYYEDIIIQAAHNDLKIPIILVGCKCDQEEMRQIAYDEANQIAKDLGLKYIETSAKNNINCKELLEQILKLSLQHENQNQNNSQAINIGESLNEQKVKKQQFNCC